MSMRNIFIISIFDVIVGPRMTGCERQVVINL
jgi:hypothetical protein